MIYYASQYYGTVPLDDFIEHHGVKGQKWGTRRFQNPDGSLTPAGRDRYGIKERLRNAKDRHEANVVSRYKGREIHRLDKTYKRELKRAKRNVDIWDTAYKKEVSRSDPSQRTLAVIADKYQSAATEYAGLKGMKAHERKRILEATIRDVRSENARKGIHAASVITAAMLGVQVNPGTRHDLDVASRFTDSDKKRIVKEAELSGERARRSLEGKHAPNTKRHYESEDRVIKSMINSLNKDDPDYEEQAALLRELERNRNRK